MFYLGSHLSFSKGYEAMGKEAHRIGANTFQFFTRSPRGGKAKALDLSDIEALKKLIEEYKFDHLLAHAPYTMNPCSANDYVREIAEEVMLDDIYRMSFFENSLYNFHPGSHVGQGVEVGIQLTADMLNRVLNSKQVPIVLLETMAGKGSEIGKSFEELKDIIDKVEVKEKIGVCWDTCHLYDAGYDLVNKLDEVIEDFDALIGLDKLYAIHINDSKNPFKSGKDRHENIGKGSLGLDTFINIINHPKLRHLPFYLETPESDDIHKEEIALLRKHRQ